MYKRQTHTGATVADDYAHHPAELRATLTLSLIHISSHIEVTGSTRYTAEDIIEAAGLGEEQNLFTVSQKALNQKITALCPCLL